MESDNLNIFDVLSQINKKNFHYLESLPDDVRKQFSPYVVHQWLTCTDSSEQYTLLAHFVNDKVLELSNHPNLLFKLYCATSCGTYTRYNWIYKKKESSLPITVIAEYLKCSKRVAKMHLPGYEKADIVKMAKKLGYQDAEIKSLLK